MFMGTVNEHINIGSLPVWEDGEKIMQGNEMESDRSEVRGQNQA